MSKPGDVMDNPLTGEKIIWRETAQETNGARVVYEQHMPQGAGSNGEHIHHNFQEDFEIVSGVGTYWLSGNVKKGQPGDKWSVPAKTRHKNPFNENPEELVVMITVTPDMGTQTFFETLFGLARDGKVTKAHRMPFWQLVVIANYIPGRTTFTKAPAWLQIYPLPIVAFFGRLMGYKPRYDKYSGPAT